MKKNFRKAIGYMVVLPFAVVLKSLSIFIGQEKAIKIVGLRATKLAKQFLKFWVPKIDDAKDFDSFPAKMKKNLRLWKLLYDVEISEENTDIFKLHVSNCPFCEALDHLGMSKLGPYVCEGDWAIARDNGEKWIFERNYQIGTGDSYCDHTYKRIGIGNPQIKKQLPDKINAASSCKHGHVAGDRDVNPKYREVIFENNFY